GIVRNENGGWFYVDGVNDSATWRTVKAAGADSKIVIIAKESSPLEPQITSAWNTYCGVPFSLE
ncbi:MAG: GTP-binding protein, partial [Bilophila wadsworthia]